MQQIQLKLIQLNVRSLLNSRNHFWRFSMFSEHCSHCKLHRAWTSLIVIHYDHRPYGEMIAMANQSIANFKLEKYKCSKPSLRDC